MSLAAIALSALVLAVLVSCTTRLNVGILSIALAWIVGVYIGGMGVADIMAGFPSQLFLTLSGVTLLFTLAQVNGTLDRIATRAVHLCRGNRGMIPILFFIMAAALASIGPGNIATAALLGPMAMAIAARSAIPLFLMAIMVGNGANSGALSPFAPTGVIVNGIMARLGMPGHELSTWANNLGAHAFVAFGAYFALGGWKLFAGSAGPVNPEGPELPAREPFDWCHWLTVGVIIALVGGVLAFELNIGLAAFASAGVLVLCRAADQNRAIQRMPWGTILMVTGVTVLIALVEKARGIDLFTDFLAWLATPGSVTAVVAFLTGVISVYSSTSGVVLPAFLPMVPGLSARLGGVDPVAIASAMNVGGHLVDVSPLSTIGALCLAAVPPGDESRTLFNQLLAWGLSMCVVGAAVSWLLFGR